MLGWSGKHYDVLAAYGFYAPTGEEDIGLDFWTHQLQLAGTWYPFDDKGTAVMVASTYEIHHEKEDQDLTPGSRFTLNWGISQYLPLNPGNAPPGAVEATGRIPETSTRTATISAWRSGKLPLSRYIELTAGGR
ncbi:MAG: transporter, partial [Gammaproteobacteria bacterium]